ncbi:hypothetical protein GLOTRDRAFT_131828 [Gloeophyllum trabeum ATCC 11539]|uniref:Uncharacterized protein n=1 Tax=Gloeophyllum trabeum (strain ATCC 11539 / FP-39264 / Madison 617) TaxID=670483 RepID=S7PYR3_GLOTA|nr:uncharacterized protein GLOTRDRAFT_131828 [Gloeophyllum trabeum ATCC 11539]EPQ52593.1 hypothetical protein GLOTRDRAFT_131828 [Gloeophyllum trabeum ATCC 11539]
MAKDRSEALQGMSMEERDIVMQMDGDLEAAPDLSDQALNSMPPGEEGYGLSHEGGEYEVFEDFANDLAQLTGM